MDRDRLWSNLMERKDIGGHDDATTGLRGVRRPALTDEDAQARHRVIAWMQEAGLAVRIDRVGNGTDVLADAVRRLADQPWSRPTLESFRPRVDQMEMDTRVGCYAWIEREGLVLLTYWSVPPTAPGLRHQGWTLPGGGMESGEQVCETVVREVAEETGYQVEVGAYVGTDSRHRSAKQRPDGGVRPLHHLRIIYRARIIGGEFAVEVGDTTADARWFPRHQITELDRVSLVDVALRLVGDPLEDPHDR